MKAHKRWILLALSGLLLLAWAWFCYTPDSKVTGLRNILQYEVVKRFGEPLTLLDEPAGALYGTIRTTDGEPLADAVALVASPIGHTYTAVTDEEGHYRLADVPPGRYVPVAGTRGYSDGLDQSCIAGLCRKNMITVRPGATTLDVDLWLSAAPSPKVVLDDSLLISPTMSVQVGAPFPSESLRTHFSFERAGLRANECYLYEPLEGEGPFPTMLLVLPGPVLGWEIIPVPFAAEGFSVLACYPLRGFDIDEDAVDLLTALEYLRQARLPSRADTDRLALVAASFTSLHAYRLLGLTDQVDVALVLGGMADGFAFRRDVEMGMAETRAPFDQALVALGLPNTSPELYFKYSVVYHLEGLPPLCLLHGKDDELVPYNQGVLLDRELTRQGMPHEFHSYDGLSHYFSTSADNATTQQMFQDSGTCLRRWLEVD